MRMCILPGNCLPLKLRGGVGKPKLGIIVLLAGFGCFVGEELDDDAAEVLRARLDV